MRLASGLGVSLAAALAVAVAVSGAAADADRRSGTIVAVDPAASTLVVEEIGPGRAGQAGNEIARHRVTVEPSTTVTVVSRTPGSAPDGWPGSFVEMRLGREALKQGAFVTVTLRRDQGQLTAEQVTVVNPGGFEVR